MIDLINPPSGAVDIFGSNDAESLAWSLPNKGRGSARYSVEYDGNRYSVYFMADDTDKLVTLKCGCITIGDDGSIITCWEHTNPTLRTLFERSVPL